MSSLLTNVSSMQALRVLQSIDTNMSGVANQVATGLKVGNAKHNAAIWSVSFAIRSDVNTLHAVRDGLSRTEAELAMIGAATGKITELLDQARERAIHLDGATSEQARQAIRADVVTRIQQAEQIIADTSFNGATLLDGEERRVVTGARGETIVIGGREMSSTTLGLDAILAKVDSVVPPVETTTSTSSPATPTGRVFGNDALSAGTAVAGPGGGNGITGSIAQTSAVNVDDGASDFVKMLAYGAKWGGSAQSGAALTYSLYNGTQGYSYAPGAGAITALNASYQAAVRDIMTYASGLSGVTFTEVTESAGVVGDFRFAEYADGGGTAFAYLPNSAAAGGDTFITTGITGAYATVTAGAGYPYQTIIHELGHALGLKHPHEANIDDEYNYDGSAYDHLKYSVMSYKDFAGDTNDGYGADFFPTSFMVGDIAALQAMYGVGAGNSGDDTYSWSGRTFETIWDGGGVDTIDLSNKTGALDIDLTPGSYSNVGTTVTFEGTVTENYTLGIAYGTIVENVIGGSGSDRMKGNEANNTFTGGLGNDVIDGGAGWNVAVFNGNKADYTISDEGNGTVRVIGRDGRDTLTNIQELRFDDGSVDISDLAPPLTAAEYEAQQTSGYSISLGLRLDAMIDVAMSRVLEVGAAFGSEAVQIETAQTMANSLIDELTRANGILVDADMTHASARMQALQVQQQLAISSLSIANGNSQTLLQLFR
ncbi:flagellin [Caenispirillum bisanense]|uniref:Flagellin n=1 Tax=Caenispirillum bisanense TaxID=414052 RepID=A0A286H104_9PROT|nr:M10 family metallopeptidase C-terminal domain-containing protein [Caenispirillum bisanense]SOE01447.1 Flagellin FlgL [Caenispirillum bisanense]